MKRLPTLVPRTVNECVQTSDPASRRGGWNFLWGHLEATSGTTLSCSSLWSWDIQKESQGFWRRLSCKLRDGLISLEVSFSGNYPNERLFQSLCSLFTVAIIICPITMWADVQFNIKSTTTKVSQYSDWQGILQSSLCRFSVVICATFEL